MSFKQLPQPDHLEHVGIILPQRVIILSILITLQKQAIFTKPIRHHPPPPPRLTSARHHRHLPPTSPQHALDSQYPARNPTTRKQAVFPLIKQGFRNPTPFEVN